MRSIQSQEEVDRFVHDTGLPVEPCGPSAPFFDRLRRALSDRPSHQVPAKPDSLDQFPYVYVAFSPELPVFRIQVAAGLWPTLSDVEAAYFAPDGAPVFRVSQQGVEAFSYRPGSPREPIIEETRLYRQTRISFRASVRIEKCLDQFDSSVPMDAIKGLLESNEQNRIPSAAEVERAMEQAGDLMTQHGISGGEVNALGVEIDDALITVVSNLLIAPKPNVHS